MAITRDGTVDWKRDRHRVVERRANRVSDGLCHSAVDGQRDGHRVAQLCDD